MRIQKEWKEMLCSSEEEKGMRSISKKIKKFITVMAVIALTLCLVPMQSYASGPNSGDSDTSEVSMCDSSDGSVCIESGETYRTYKNSREGSAKDDESDNEVTAQSLSAYGSYTVLVLDVSGENKFYSNRKLIYTADSSIKEVKKAALKFIDGVSQKRGNNYIALVTYAKAGKIRLKFTDDYSSVREKVEGLSAEGGGTNIAEGLEKAGELFEDINKHAKKNTVLCTTGHTNIGYYDYSGHYNSSTVGSTWYNMDTNIKLYAYANAAYEEAKFLKNESTIYSIGIFKEFDGMPSKGKAIVQFFKLVASDLASSAKCFIDIDDEDRIQGVFDEIFYRLYDERENDFNLGCISTPVDIGCNKTIDIDMDWGATLFEYDSEEYDQALSRIGCILGRACQVYANNKSNSSAGICGLMNSNMKMQNVICSSGYTSNSLSNPAYTIGYRSYKYNGETKYLICLVCPGELSIDKDASDIFSKKDGFKSVGDEIYNQLCRYISNTLGKNALNDPENLRFFITGYSYGGAEAAIVGQNLVNEGVANMENTFVYTVASPTYYIDTDCFDEEGYECCEYIHNLMNTDDVITLLPRGYFHAGYYWLYDVDEMEKSSSFIETVNKLHNVEKSVEPKGWKYEHNILTYLACVMAIEPSQYYSNNSELYNRITVDGPADIELYNSNGNIMGYTEGQKTVLNEESEVLIDVNENSKCIYCARSKDYSIKITGTSSGTLKYRVEQIDSMDNKVVKSKTYKNISIENGKTFATKVGSTNSYKTAYLYTVDDNGNIMKELKTTGKEAKPEMAHATTEKLANETYDGKKHTPDFVLEMGGVRIPSEDYKVVYKNNKNVGTATVRISSKGKYSGVKVAEFRINPKGTSINTLASDKASLTVKWKKQGAKMPKSKITGYQIRYSTDKGMYRSESVSLKGCNKVSKKITLLEDNTDYYVQIRTYMKKGKKIYYSDWSEAETAQTM